MREANGNSGDKQQPKDPIEIQAVAEPDSKRRGEAVEAEFVARATTMGFAVLTPWGDSDRYDVVIDHGRGFWRMQIKSVTYHRAHGYEVKARRGRKLYTTGDFDFLAVFIVPLNAWYILPIGALKEQKGITFYPCRRGKAKYEEYREAWCLLDCTRQARGWKDIPAVCRCQQLAVRCAVCPLRE